MDASGPAAAPEEGSVERRIVTVLFADLVAFTTLSERLDAEDVATIQDAYFAAVRGVMARYRGVLEKFIGDAAMAVFGIPRALDDDAERAVRAGLALIAAVEQLGFEVGLDPGDLQLRVGVNTGEVVHAHAGPDAGRVTGDTVNTAARFQAAAQPQQVLVGETTALAVAEAIDLAPVGRLTLKGKAEPVRAWSAAGVRPSRSRDEAMGRLRAPITGRDDDLAWLGDGLRTAREHGRAQRRLVVALPGVGKSRLVAEFVARCRAEGTPAWHARLRPDVVSPYDPLAQLFAAALEDAKDEPAVRERLGASLGARGASAARAAIVADHVVAVLWPSAESGAQGVVDRDASFAALLEALDAIEGGAPSVWAFEDVHWGGGDVLAFLDQATAAGSSSGRLVVCTSRPSLLERAPTWSADDPEAGRRVLHLTPLSAPDAGELVRALVGGALPASLVTTIAERSDGNPLFIEELLRTWVSVGVLEEGPGGGWRLAADAADVPLPPTVQAIYAAQLDDLPPSARRTARRASVAGRRFAVGALEPLGIADPDAVEPLRARALVRGPEPGRVTGPTYAYRHALLRDAGYASLARAERARLHVSLARWLERAAGERAAEVAEEIGRHYASAVESTPALSATVDGELSPEEAIRLAAAWLERAGGAALAAAAQDAAQSLFRAALDHTPEGDAVDRARRWERLGDATAFAANMDEGGAAFARAAEEYRAAMDDPAVHGAAREGFARATAALGAVWGQQLRFEDAARLADAALGTIGTPDDLSTGRLLYLRGHSRSMFALHSSVGEDADRALALARAHGDRHLELDAVGLLFQIALEDPDAEIDDLRRRQDEVMALARELREWRQLTSTMRTRAFATMLDDTERTWPVLDECARLAEEHGLREDGAWTDYARAEAGLVSGDWDRAVEAGLRALDVADANAYHRAAVRTWFAVTPIALARGEMPLLRRARAWFTAHRAIFPGSPFGLLMHGAVDLWFREAGIEADPAPSVDQVLPIWEESPSWFSSFWDAADVLADEWIHRGDLEAARRWLDGMARWHDHPLETAFGRSVHVLIGARLAEAEGRTPDAAAMAREAAAAFRTCRAPWWTRKALRVAERTGGATSEEEGEMAEIASGLRLAPAVRA